MGKLEQCKHGMRPEWCALCNPATPNFDLSFATIEKNNPSVSVKTLAKQTIESLSETRQKSLLLEFLSRAFDQARRSRVRNIEVQSVVKPATSALRAKEALERWRDRPWTAPRTSRTFKTFTSQPVWLKEKQRAEKDLYYADYLKSGSKDKYESWMFAEAENAFEKFREATRQKVVLELTSELLGSEFALGSGRKTTWGSATIKQHTERIQLLLSQAEGSFAAANRHKAAIDLLVKYHADCLNQVSTGAVTVC